jgi:type I site-specific restriction endonuclease
VSIASPIVLAIVWLLGKFHKGDKDLGLSGKTQEEHEKRITKLENVQEEIGESKVTMATMQGSINESTKSMERLEKAVVLNGNLIQKILTNMAVEKIRFLQLETEFNRLRRKVEHRSVPPGSFDARNRDWQGGTTKENEEEEEEP